jgi:predicted TIM-barrel fold metal-dependent hydrolase
MHTSKQIKVYSLIGVSTFLIIATNPVSVRAEIPAKDGWPEVKVIDMHTHVFNARDLPLVGVLNALGAPRPVAVVVAEAILASMPEEAGEPKREVSMNEIERPTIQDLSEPQRNILLDYVGRERMEPLRAAAAHLEVKPDVTLLAETTAKIGFPADDSLVQAVVIQRLTKAVELGAALKGYIRFIGIMTKGHGEIVAALQKSYPQVDLFVHHMMDMAGAYDDTPTVPFSDQTIMMQKLDAAFPGKLLHFTAFDPFRRGGALPLVQHAVKDYSAVGLKIYPPSGYRAAENAIYKFPPRPGLLDIWGRKRWNSRYAGWTEADLDSTLRDAFAWASTNMVPLFTHCTPGGFEAVRAKGSVPGYGMMADPFFWASALKTTPGLRMCFGHSGGEAYWFSDPANDAANQKNKPPGDNWQFGNQVVDLCLTYPDVYCEVGYLSGVLEPKQAAALVHRLEAVINLLSKDGKWRFGDKLMYGTDWHMIYKEPNYDRYLEKWDDVIKQVDKGGWRQAFLAGNAKKFLRLDTLTHDPRFTPAQQKQLLALSGGIK